MHSPLSLALPNHLRSFKDWCITQCYAQWTVPEMPEVVCNHGDDDESSFSIQYRPFFWNIVFLLSAYNERGWYGSGMS